MKASLRDSESLKVAVTDLRGAT
ncbi:MAG: hypothetical protein QOI78_5054, partial [Actinomycetota bacterium]|nr:hypothetical protein [Actinomycetota bacterium]